MEEILFTYKSKVEDKLAAEGKALPKVKKNIYRQKLQNENFILKLNFSLFQDIFDDFTEHWVASSPHRAKSVDSLDSSERSSEPGSVSKTSRTPNQRKEHRDGQQRTRIPAPTFYKSQSKGCL